MDDPQIPTRTTHDSFPFQATNEEFTEELETVRLKQGRRIFDQDRSNEQFYLVRQGLLGIFRHVYPDKRIVLYKIGAGTSIGLAQCLGDSAFPGQLIPLKDTVAYRGSRKQADPLCERCPSEVHQLLLQENEINQEVVRKVDDLIGKRLESRIAIEVLDLASRIGQSTEDGIRIIVKLSRKKISNMTGCAHESVIRIMSRWEERGWIKTDRKHITVLRPHKLETVAAANGKDSEGSTPG